ncbi:MAG: luciferase family protein [Gaiellaceae bacterium]
MEDNAAHVAAEILTWEGVSRHEHRFGGLEFRLGKRELGHIHPEGWADFPFTARIRDMLVETGRATPHRFGVKGWVSRDLDDPNEVVELFRLSYERAQVAEAVRASREQLGEAVGGDVSAGDDDPDPTA